MVKQGEEKKKEQFDLVGLVRSIDRSFGRSLFRLQMEKKSKVFRSRRSEGDFRNGIELLCAAAKIETSTQFTSNANIQMLKYILFLI